MSTDAKDFIADKGYDSNYGARPLKRAIQKYLEDPLAEEIIKAELVEGDTIDVTFEKETSTLKIAIIKANIPPPAKSGSRKKKEE
jgi:ATP-dependent Clp protease ATP-binding subunit ClpC